MLSFGLSNEGFGFKLVQGVAPLDRLVPKRSSLSHGATLPITMLPVEVDSSEPVPLYEQVAADIRRAIADGEAKPGERLPPAKDLASVLGVNSNTVLRALRTLRDEGLLDFQRGRGVTVAGSSSERGMVVQRAHELVKYARSQGFRRDELIQIIEGI
jgi:GntR family transcriptional regulator